MNISRAKNEIHETNFYLHVLYADGKYYQNENKICVTRPNVMEITRQSEHFDWFKDNSESHEGLEGTQRTNQMRRNITCKFTWLLWCSTWEEWQLEKLTQKRSRPIRKGVQKFYLAKKILN